MKAKDGRVVVNKRQSVYIKSLNKLIKEGWKDPLTGYYMKVKIESFHGYSIIDLFNDKKQGKNIPIAEAEYGVSRIEGLVEQLSKDFTMEEFSLILHGHYRLESKDDIVVRQLDYTVDASVLWREREKKRNI